MRASDLRFVDKLIEQLLIDVWPDRVLREGFLRKYLGDHKSRLAARVVIENGWGEPLIDEIPSETTPAERRLLYMFFRHFWSGDGNVFEIGPFLGGTTRAIAMGMEINPRCRSEALLYTADKFSKYYDKEALKCYLKPLYERGALTAEDLDAIGDKGEFRLIFERIHRCQPYWRRLRVLDSILPDLPEHLTSHSRLLDLSHIAPISAFFIDGCKSWFGTKYFLKQAAASAAPDAWFIFQDYGMYTCFWIPLCIYLLRDHFRLLMFTDCTYVWAQVSPFTPDEVDRVIPDRVEQLALSHVDKAFDHMLEAAHEREDRRAQISLRLQHAAFYAYRGDLAIARRMIDDLANKDEALGYEDLIARARKAPTYRPRLGDPAWETIYLD